MSDQIDSLICNLTGHASKACLTCSLCHGADMSRKIALEDRLRSQEKVNVPCTDIFRIVLNSIIMAWPIPK
jgi:hypothetical protein